MKFAVAALADSRQHAIIAMCYRASAADVKSFSILILTLTLTT